MISRDAWPACQHGLSNLRSWITNFDNCFDQSGCFNKKQQQIDKKKDSLRFLKAVVKIHYFGLGIC